MTPASGPPGEDPFDAAALRGRVLASWTASPDRFREDANAEEALALGGYAGRAVVELAANAVDAAAEAGVPARLRVRLTGGELRVANTGAPLTAAGVAALSSLRASAKRDSAGSVGHFGVGFTAVRTLSDAPQVISRSGGVAFSRAATARCIASTGSAALNAEVADRRGDVPLLRLPFPVDDAAPPPDGYATEVRLPLRPEVTGEVRELLARLDDLFWALPALAEIDLAAGVLTRTTHSDGSITIAGGVDQPRRFRQAACSGIIPADLLVGLPVEQQRRNTFRVAWVAELGPAGAVVIPASGQPLGAPTATDEMLTLPARLVGTFPVDDSRRHLAAGPLTDHLLGVATARYADLVAALPPDARADMIPPSAFPAGDVDAKLHDGITDMLRRTPFLITAAGEAVEPGQACLLEGIDAAGAALLSLALPGLLLPPARPAQAAALRLVGVRAASVPEVTGALGALDAEPGYLHEVYRALTFADSEDLGDIPVPLAGGGRAFGARGLLLPDAAALPVDLAGRAAGLLPGLRLVHPGAAHPLLLRLGARPVSPEALLGDPALVAACDELSQALDDDGPDPRRVRDIGHLVLDLIRAGGVPGEELLSSLVLTGADGEPWPAAELMVPNAALAAVLEPDTPMTFIGAEWVSTYSTDLLVAAGVRDGFRTVLARPETDLPGFDQWLTEVADHSPPEMVTAIADLDLVADEAWPLALRMLADGRDTRDAITDATVHPSYAGWWIAGHAIIGGARLADYRTRQADELTGLYDVLPVDLTEQFATAVGVHDSLAHAVTASTADVLDRLCDPGRPMPPGRVRAVTEELAAELLRRVDVVLPRGVRTLAGTVSDAASALVLDVPWLAAVLPAARLVPGGRDPEQTAEAFDLELASSSLRVQVSHARSRQPDRARVEAAAAALGVAAPAGIRVVANLTVRVDGGAAVPVRWWGSAGGLLVDGSAEAIGRAVAWAAGRWDRRHAAIAAAAGDLTAVAEDSLG